METQLELADQGLRTLPIGRPTGIDLFAGAGGFSCGMQAGGCEIVAAVEMDRGACATLRANKKNFFPNMVIIEQDIMTLTGKELLLRAGVKDLDVLFGGPPCQGFSTSNIRTRGLDDPRSKLMNEFVRMVREIQPKVFMIENVAGLFQTFKDFIVLLMDELEKCGYVVRFNMIDCAGYGVPQRRVRILIHGDRKDLNKIPEFPIYSHYSNPELEREVWPPYGCMMPELFPVNGFPKERIHRLKWHRNMTILIDQDTIGDQVEIAVGKLIGQQIIKAQEAHDKKRA